MSAAPTLNARAIAEQLLAIERALDLEAADWRIGDVHLWPMYRLELYRLLFVAQAGPASGPRGRPTLGPALKPTESAPARADRACPVWLVSDGISFSTLGNRQVERFCGPLHDELARLGIPSVLIDRGSPRRRPGQTPTRWWMPMTLRAKLRGALRSTLTPDRRHDRLTREVERAVQRLNIALPSPSPRRFDAMARAMISLADALTRRMRREQVRAVFVVGYYDVSGYAYVLAANRVGAVSVDVQHGVTGALNMAYADWNVVPTGGLTLLPRLFWCWSDEDARIVDQWGDAHHPTHYRTVVGGHPFLEAWRTGLLHLPPEGQQALDRLVASAQGEPAVVVTLQPHLASEEALAPLLQSWLLQPRAAWWIRLHPLAQADRPRIEALLERHGVTHWNIDEASSLPLPVLLREAALHGTHSSSTVIEAELLDVPSIVWSDYGEQLFDAHIRRGSAVRVSDGHAFVRVLEDRRRMPEKTSANASATISRLPRALQAILNAAP